MRSIKFPKMFNSKTSSTQVWTAAESEQATKQNISLLLKSERGELIGDPYFGLMLRHYLFNQNNYVLKDQIVDMIYTQLATFIPQIRVKRKDISVFQDRENGKLYCEFSGINQTDFTLNTYQLVLFDENETSK